MKQSKQRKTQSKPQPAQASSSRWIAGSLAALSMVIIALLLVFRPWASDPAPPTESTPTIQAETVSETESMPAASFVGGTHCAQCHTQEYEHWQQSHHDLAMQEATADTVLGDFDQAVFEYRGVRTEFYQRDGQFWIKTDGPDGTLQDYPVRYVFGVEPLQQYLLPMPGGRLQAFSIAWDSRPADQGGQRWFHLYPEETISHSDPLHWTKPSQNWNYMCAECHSTQLQKQYDDTTDSYRTEFAEIDVSCEACHGPGSNHIQWASQPDDYSSLGNMGLTHLFNERVGTSWHTDPASGQPVRSEPRQTEVEIQVCAACHSRRGQLFEDDRQGQPLTDSFVPALLTDGLYHPDGQILDEVYVYGSFLQSKMYAAGVTCSDCHNPHSLELKLPGNGVCLQCHQADAYNTPDHHHHQSDSAGGQCVNCHMAEQTYMQVDARRDHSFRIPRPDRTLTLGTPNACNQCHDDKSADWATQTVKDWYGELNPGHQTFAETLAKGRERAPGSDRALLRLVLDQSQPVIARATAAQMLENWPSALSFEGLSAAARESDPIISLAVLDGIRSFPLEQRWQLASPLLDAPTRSVRAMAANRVADMPLSRLNQAQKFRLQQAAREYVESQNFNADTPQAHVNLGGFYQAQGYTDKALKAYREAIKRDPDWTPAYVNLADLYREQQQDSKVVAVLQQGLDRQPLDPSLHHSMGLVQVRLKHSEQALAALSKAVELDPRNSRYRYVYAVALHSYGKTEDAIRVLDEGLAISNDQSLHVLRMQLEQQ